MGSAAAVASDRVHRHAAGRRPSEFWEIRLAPRDAGPPPEVPRARAVFRSGVLQGIPPRPTASMIDVVLPPKGGETTVHSHPGPEFVYQVSGVIDYQNDLIGTRKLRPGEAEGIPPGTAVQKRNPATEEASFLSWFLVDPRRPFAPPAEF